jgi:hypothetical protein
MAASERIGLLIFETRSLLLYELCHVSARCGASVACVRLPWPRVVRCPVVVKL